MKIVKDKPKSTIFTEEYRRNFRLQFIAAHNKKIEKQKEKEGKP